VSYPSDTPKNAAKNEIMLY